MTHPIGGSNAVPPTGELEAVRVELLGGFRMLVGPRIIGEEEWRLRKAGSLVKLLALARAQAAPGADHGPTPAGVGPGTGDQ